MAKICNHNNVHLKFKRLDFMGGSLTIKLKEKICIDYKVMCEFCVGKAGAHEA